MTNEIYWYDENIFGIFYKFLLALSCGMNKNENDPNVAEIKHVCYLKVYN